MREASQASLMAWADGGSEDMNGGGVGYLRRMLSGQRDWTLFLLASVFLGITSGMYETSFNNYLNDVFKMSAETRGLLEFPREAPGVSIIIITSVLAFLPEVKVAVLAVGLWALGLFGLGLLSPTMPLLVLWMMTLSVGAHLYMPLNQSIGVGVAKNHQVGTRLGQLAGANTAAVIVGAGIVWLGTGYFNLGYVGIFVTSGVAALLAALCLLPMKVRKPESARKGKQGKPRFVLKRRYGLFYALSVLFGARKQIFITFAPWVIIKVFGQPASTIAVLWIVSSVLGIAFKPALGKLVDLYGERKILMGEAAMLILVCLGYASGESLRFGGLNLGLHVTYACFVADQLLMAVGIARTTYLNKIIEDPRDLTPTLSFGISIDHVVSMTVPALGGMLWASLGYESVFVAAAAVALINLAVAGQIRVPAGGATALSGQAAARPAQNPSGLAK